MPEQVQVVWLKRDLRLTDHEPLCEAAERGPTVVLFIVEPWLWTTPPYDPTHYATVRAALEELDAGLRPLGRGEVARRTEHTRRATRWGRTDGTRQPPAGMAGQFEWCGIPVRFGEFVSDLRCLPGFLSPDECHRLTLRAESAGFAPATVRTSAGRRWMPHIRDNLRADFRDEEWVDALWHRLRCHLGPDAVGLDPRLRVYRYEPGQRFKGHRDGAVTVDGFTSRLSFLVYLNEDMTGGQTCFGRGVERRVVEPELGMGVWFEHGLWHEGAPVVAGQKDVLRTDVLFANPP